MTIATGPEGEPALSQTRFFANGQWQAPHSRKTIDLVSPSSEQVIGTVPDCDPVDVDTAVASARRVSDARDGWAQWPQSARSDALLAIADELDARKQELAVLQAHQVGRPIMSRGGNRPGEILRYFAEVSRTYCYEEVRESPHFRGHKGLSRSTVRWEPRGVTAAIAPYNGTLNLGLYKIAPTLAVGGAAVFKPPPQSPLDAYVLAEAAASAGVPPGVLSVVSGGSETGEALVRHPGVDIVAFTGSTAAGRKIASICGEMLRPLTLELGGKSAAVVLGDADLDAFEAALPFIGFTFSGQNCFIHSRIVAVDSVYNEVVARAAQVAQNLTLGDPFDSATELGPLISRDHANFVQQHVDRAVGEGATVVTGGSAPKGFPTGWYFSPTVLSGVTASMAIAREELFGPVLSVMRARDEGHALEIANDTEFGLGGSVWTQDTARGNELSRLLDSGTVGVNGFGFNTAAPFESRRNSGLGVELGPEGLRTYLRPRVTQHFA